MRQKLCTNFQDNRHCVSVYVVIISIQTSSQERPWLLMGSRRPNVFHGLILLVGGSVGGLSTFHKNILV